MKHVTISLDQRRVKKDGTCPVVLIIKNVKTFRYHTGICVEPSQFSNGVIVKNREKVSLNRRLLALAEKAESLLEKRLTDDNLKRILSGDEERGAFNEFFRRCIDKSLTFKTRESYEYTYKMLCSRYDINHLTFEDISYQWLSDLETSLRKDGLSVNTVKIHFGNIRAVFNEAINSDATTLYPFRRFRIKKERTIKRSLTLEQLVALRNAKCEDYQAKYIDFFFLTFHLIGINSKDLFALTDANMNAGRLDYIRSKTHGVFSIALLPEAIELIGRMRGATRLCGFENYKTSIDLRNRVNRNLKLVCKRNGLPPCTTYWARHTWATIASELGVPDDTIALALGHQGVSPVTDRYIRRNYRLVDEANEMVAKAVDGLETRTIRQTR